jgi:DNA-binding transcriptional ArsR family regulator
MLDRLGLLDYYLIRYMSTIITWDLGSAYDFFISLRVVHQPEAFGLRASWAAGVRSRLPLEDRKTLELFDQAGLGVNLPWIYRLPEPKDTATALRVLRQLPAVERVRAMTDFMVLGEAARPVFERVSQSAAWTSSDLDELRAILAKESKPGSRRRDPEALLTIWSDSGCYGAAYLAALQAYLQNFFAEEETRLLPALQRAHRQAEGLADQPLPQLIERLTQGVQLTGLYERQEIVFVPSYWATPLVFYARLDADRSIVTYGARPPEASLIPGEIVPDALLQALKALADPTRLRILRYLAEAPLSPSELARRLRLRPPTVIHHLNALRVAGLVHITIGPDDEGRDERRYAARLEAIQLLGTTLTDFLTRDD